MKELQGSQTLTTACVAIHLQQSYSCNQETIKGLASLKTFQVISTTLCSPYLYLIMKVLWSLTLSSFSSNAPKWTFNTTLLKREYLEYSLHINWGNIWSFNVGSAGDSRILWDSVKGFILYCLPLTCAWKIRKWLGNIRIRAYKSSWEKCVPPGLP